MKPTYTRPVSGRKNQQRNVVAALLMFLIFAAIVIRVFLVSASEPESGSGSTTAEQITVAGDDEKTATGGLVLTASTGSVFSGTTVRSPVIETGTGAPVIDTSSGALESQLSGSGSVTADQAQVETSSGSTASGTVHDLTSPTLSEADPQTPAQGPEDLMPGDQPVPLLRNVGGTTPALWIPEALMSMDDLQENLSLTLTNADTTIMTMSIFAEDGSGTLVTVTPTEAFIPGAYRLFAERRKTGISGFFGMMTVIFDEEIPLGFLLASTEQSSYAVGGTSTVIASVLNASGSALCGAPLMADVLYPDRTLSRLTLADFTASTSCIKRRFTADPDYALIRTIPQNGTTLVTLRHGSASLTLPLTTEDEPLTVKRSAVTRTYTNQLERTEITVSARSTLTATVTERVPAGVTVVETSPGGYIDHAGQATLIVYDMQLVPGAPATLWYTYRTDHEGVILPFGPMTVKGSTETQQGDEAEAQDVMPPNDVPAGGSGSTATGSVTEDRMSLAPVQDMSASGAIVTAFGSMMPEAEPTMSGSTNQDHPAIDVASGADVIVQPLPATNDNAGSVVGSGAGLPQASFFHFLFPSVRAQNSLQTISWSERRTWFTAVVTNDRRPSTVDQNPALTLDPKTEGVVSLTDGARFTLLREELTGTDLLDEQGRLKDSVARTEIARAVIDQTDMEQAALRALVRNQAAVIGQVLAEDSLSVATVSRTLDDASPKRLRESVASAVSADITQSMLTQEAVAAPVADALAPVVDHLLTSALTDRIIRAAADDTSADALLDVAITDQDGSLTAAAGKVIADSAKNQVQTIANVVVQEKGGSSGESAADGSDATHQSPLDSAQDKLPAAQSSLIQVKLTDKSGRTFSPNFHFEQGSVVLVVEPERAFVPGLYTLDVTITNPLTNETQTLTQNFAWGVLAMNTDQDRYLTNQTGSVAIGVLDDHGAIICDAQLKLSVTAPSGAVTEFFSEKTGGIFGIGETPPMIITTGICGQMDSMNITPDYEAILSFEEEGTYTLKLVAETENGVREMTQKLTVNSQQLTVDNNDNQQPQTVNPVIISRTATTRLYPVGNSPMTITVEFLEDFEGTITETVPEGFEISDIAPTPNPSSVPGEGDEQSIEWKGSWEAGEVATFSYLYDAPDVSPQFYLVGPLELTPNTYNLTPKTSMREARAWQIANDAAKIWDGGGTTNNWSDCANWNDDTCPLSGDTVTFDATSTKDATIDTDVAIAGVLIAATYTGTITQDETKKMTVGSSDYIQNGGTFVAGSGMILNRYFTLNGGSFTAPRNTLLMNYYDFTIANDAIFSHNNGTVECVANYNYLFSPNNATFHNLIIRMKNNSTRYFGLRHNMTVAGDLLFISENTSPDYIKSFLPSWNGIDGNKVVTLLGNFTVQATQTVQFGSANYDLHMVIGGDMEMQSGPVLFNNRTTINLNGTGAQVISQHSGGSISSSLWTVEKPEAYRHMPVTLNSPLVTVTPITVTRGALDINGNDLSVLVTVRSGGTLQLDGSETILTPVLQTGSTVTYAGAAGPYTLQNWTYRNLTISGASTFNLPNAMALSGSLHIRAGTLDVTDSDYPITLSGSWINTGTFTPRNGTVTLNGSNQTLSGSTIFYNLTKTVTAAQTLLFAAGTTQTVTNTLTLQGAEDNLLSLRSTNVGSQWNIDPQGTRTLAYLDVKDSNNINETEIDGPALELTNSGNNTNWGFPVTWIGGTDLNCSTGANWDTGVMPVAGDKVIINSTASAISWDASCPSSIKSLTIGSDFAGTVTLGRSLSLSGALTVSGGTLIANNQTIAVAGDVTLAAGMYTKGTGTFTLANSATDGTQSIDFGGNSMEAIVVNAPSDTKSLLQAITTTGLTVTEGTLTQSGAIVINGNYLQSGGTFIGASEIIDINGNYTISGGSFTSTTATGSITGSFTQSGSPTWNANGGVIAFDGNTTSSTSIDASGISFHRVVINRSIYSIADPTLTIASDTTIPLGDSPTLTLNNTLSNNGYYLINNGTITIGTGTFNTTIKTTFTNNNAIVGDMSGWEMSASLANNGTISAPNLSDFSISKSITMGSASSFVSANNPTFTVGLSFIVPNTAVFPGNIVLHLEGSVAGSSTIDASTVTYRAPVTINRTPYTISDPTMTIASGTTLNLGDAPTTTLTDGSWGYILQNNGMIIIGSGAWTANISHLINNGIITCGSTSWTFNGNITNSAGRTLECPSLTGFDQNRTSASYGSFTNNGAVAFPNLSEISIDGSLTLGANASLTTAVNPTFTIGLSFIIPDSATFPMDITLHSTGSAGGNISINAPRVSYAAPVTISHSVGSSLSNYTLTIASGTTLPFGNTPTILLVHTMSSYRYSLVNQGTIVIGTGAFAANVENTFTNYGTIITATATRTNSYGYPFVSATGSTVIFTGDGDGAADTQIITDFAASYSNLVIDSTDGATDTYALGADLTAKNLTLSGGTLDASTSNYGITVNGNWTDTEAAAIMRRNGTVTIASGSTINATQAFDNLTINATGKTVLLARALSASGTLTLSGGTLDVSENNYPLTIDGDWMSNGGAFTPRSGTVTLAGTGQSIGGSSDSTFFALSKTVSGADTLTFAVGRTVTVSSGAILRGTSTSSRLSLRSSVEGNEWFIDSNPAYRNIAYVDVKDSNNSNATTILCTEGCKNSFNNTNWLFPALGHLYRSDGSTPIADTQVSLSVNGAAPADTQTTDDDGAFILNTGGNLSEGDVLTFYVNNVAGINAVTVTVTDASSLMGLDLVQDALTLRSESADPITNASLITAGANGDADITSFYALDGSNNLTIASGKKMIVAHGTYAPGAALTVGDIRILGTLAMASNPVLVSGSWNAQGGTFTASNTVTFTSTGSQNLTVGTSSFNDLSIAGTGGTVIAQDNPVIANDLTIHRGTLDVRTRTLVVAGTYTNSGTLMLNGDEFSAGFTNDSAHGITLFTGSGTYSSLADLTSFHHLTFSGAGTWSLGATTAVNGNLTIADGTFLQNDKTLAVGGSWTDTVIAPWMTTEIDGSGSTIITGSGGRVAFLGSGLTVFTGSGTIDEPSAFGDVVIDNTAETVTLTAPMTITGSLTLRTGTISQGSGTGNTLSVHGTWEAEEGSLRAGSGTVLLTSGTDQTLSGSTTFWNLSKTVAAASTLTFNAGTTQTILGTWTAKGTMGESLRLRSSVSGEQWTISPATYDLQYIDVKDSNNIAANLILAANDAVNSGNNVRWAFPIVVTVTTRAGTSLGAGIPVSLRVGSGTIATSVTNALGIATFNDGIEEHTVENVGSGSILGMWISEGSSSGATVDITNGTTLGFNVSQGVLTISNHARAAITNADLIIAANGNAPESLTEIYTMSGTTLVGTDDAMLRIAAGSTFTPGGKVIFHDYDINGSFHMGSNTVAVTGSWDATGGTVTGTNMVTFTAEVQEDITAGDNAFNDVTFEVIGPDGGWTTTGPFRVNGSQSVLQIGSTPDTSPPVISNVEADPVFDTFALVTFDTSETTTATIHYGTNSGSLTLTGSSSTLDTHHAFSMSGLTVSTLYYYRVSATDASLNTVTGSVLSFQTMGRLSTAEEVAAREAAAGGGGTTFRSNVCLFQPSLTLTDLAVATETGGTATVTWKTNYDALSAVQFGVGFDGDTKEHQLETFVKEHSIDLAGLTPAQTYVLQATSVDKCGNVTTSDDFTFTVPGEENLPPEEHAAAPEEPASSSSSSESPQTSGDARTQAIAEIQRSLDIVRSLTQQMSLLDLKQTLLAQHKSMLEVSSGIPGPILSGEPRVEPSDTSATITWSSDEPANSLVALALDSIFVPGVYEREEGDASAQVTDHKVVLTGLTPGTKYHFRVKSSTPIGTSTVSRDYVFETPEIHAKVDNYSSTVLSPQSASFRWQTNVESSSRLTLLPYREGEPQSSEAITFTNTSFTTTHALTADSLEPGTVYEVEIAGRTAAGTDVSQIIPRFATTEDSLAPALSRVKADVAISPGKDASTQVIITWETDKRATSRVRYQQGVATDPKIPMASVTPLLSSFGRTHTVILSGLTPGTVFSFQAESVDYEGRIGVSKIFTILTPRKQESIFQVITKEFEGAFGWIGKFRQ